MLAIFVLYIITLPIHHIVICLLVMCLLILKSVTLTSFVKNICMLAIFVLQVKYVLIVNNMN